MEFGVVAVVIVSSCQEWLVEVTASSEVVHCLQIVMELYQSFVTCHLIIMSSAVCRPGKRGPVGIAQKLRQPSYLLPSLLKLETSLTDLAEVRNMKLTLRLRFVKIKSYYSTLKLIVPC